MKSLGNDIFIGYEYQNPFFSFFYTPLNVEPNLLYFKLVDNVGLNTFRTYYLYFYLDKNPFALLIKPINTVDNVVKSLIIDTFIEQRKYIRLYFKRPIFDIVIDRYTGYIKDISPKGFRVKFKDMPPPSWFNNTKAKVVKIIFPDESVREVSAFPVSYDPVIKEAIFVFSQDLWKASKQPPKIYWDIFNFLKENPIFQDFVEAGFRKPRFNYPLTDFHKK